MAHFLITCRLRILLDLGCAIARPWLFYYIPRKNMHSHSFLFSWKNRYYFLVQLKHASAICCDMYPLAVWKCREIWNLHSVSYVKLVTKLGCSIGSVGRKGNAFQKQVLYQYGVSQHRPLLGVQNYRNINATFISVQANKGHLRQ